MDSKVHRFESLTALVGTFVVPTQHSVGTLQQETQLVRALLNINFHLPLINIINTNSTPTSMEHIFKSAALGASLLILYYFLTLRNQHQVSHRQGCQPPPEYRHIDPFLGLDYVLGTNSNMPSIFRHHSAFGHTFRTNFLGTTHLNTCSTENARRAVEVAGYEAFLWWGGYYG